MLSRGSQLLMRSSPNSAVELLLSSESIIFLSTSILSTVSRCHQQLDARVEHVT